MSDRVSDDDLIHFRSCPTQTLPGEICKMAQELIERRAAEAKDAKGWKMAKLLYQMPSGQLPSYGEKRKTVRKIVEQIAREAGLNLDD